MAFCHMHDKRTVASYFAIFRIVLDTMHHSYCNIICGTLPYIVRVYRVKIKISQHDVAKRLTFSPWLKIHFIFQHYLTMIGAIVSIPFILTPALCMENEDPARGQIISTMIFVTGIVTYIQATWGCRLPIVQVNR